MVLGTRFLWCALCVCVGFFPLLCWDNIIMCGWFCLVLAGFLVSPTTVGLGVKFRVLWVCETTG